MQFVCLYVRRNDLITRLDRISVVHHLPNRRSPPESRIRRGARASDATASDSGCSGNAFYIDVNL